MKNKKFLIVSDLDGTLLNKKGELSQTTIDGIKRIVGQGHIFCIATGRSMAGAIHIYNQLGLNSLMINNNGSFISNPSDANFSPLNLVFNKEIAKKILKNKKIKEIVSNAFLECRGKIYKLNDQHNENLKKDLLNYYHIDLDNETIVDLQNDPTIISCDVYAIFLYLDNKNTEQFDKIIYHIKNASDCLQVRSIKLPRGGIIVEINTIFGDKSMGVNYLSSYYGIPRDRIIAFGDGDNDVRMLSKVKYGFAMKNGKDATKVLSYCITKHTNDDDGVIWDMNYFLNGKESVE